MRRSGKQNTCCKSCECRDESACKRVTGLFDSGSHEINAHRIEDRLCAGKRDRGDKSNMRVRSELLEKIQQKSGRGRRREHFYNSKRNKFSGKSDQIRKVSDQCRDKIEKSRCAEYSDCGHQSNQCGHNTDDSKNPLLAPLINVS